MPSPPRFPKTAKILLPSISPQSQTTYYNRSHNKVVLLRVCRWIRDGPKKTKQTQGFSQSAQRRYPGRRVLSLRRLLHHWLGGPDGRRHCPHRYGNGQPLAHRPTDAFGVCPALFYRKMRRRPIHPRPLPQVRQHGRRLQVF